ncbi:outer membrane transport energization protein TonB [Bradyrhizobium macuxiense]|uniref:Outer membrane transport energization protein TonB n=1 Tax=Bradyrhizobium macuxiense TaxID=1755647 RepID=A0A560LL50_9BRAD|nr:TonB C-terminal domain-containing protein [Bradyrhizobium macuxiense]TWB96273.1 outer membrane transport energization protein TonB [Bradyrhizobium macuxiense]
MNAPMRDQNAQAARATPPADEHEAAAAPAPAAAPTPARNSTAARKGERSVLLRYGAVVAVIALFLGGIVYFFLGHDDMPPPRQVRDLTIVNVTLPPPPPPPPPPPQPEQKMIEQPKMAEPEFKEEKPVDKPKDEPAKEAKNDEPPGPLSLDAKPTGPGDLFNLGGKPGGSPYGGGGGGGSRFGWYATIITSQIEAAIRANPKTRNMATQIQVRLWVDGSGHITRVVLTPSSGSPEVDAALRNEVIGQLTLREPPPKDMPMPVVTRVTARRPS